MAIASRKKINRSVFPRSNARMTAGEKKPAIRQITPGIRSGGVAATSPITNSAHDTRPIQIVSWRVTPSG